MSDDHEEKLGALVKVSCQPVRASPVFKEVLLKRMLLKLPEKPLPRERLFGMGIPAWFTVSAMMSLVLMVYGLVSVPGPQVVIHAPPLPQESGLPESSPDPLYDTIEFDYRG